MSILIEANKIAQQELMWELYEKKTRAEICGCKICVTAYNNFIKITFSEAYFQENRMPIESSIGREHIPVS